MKVCISTVHITDSVNRNDQCSFSFVFFFEITNSSIRDELIGLGLGIGRKYINRIDLLIFFLF